MFHFKQLIGTTLLLLLAGLFCVPRASACSVPVFQYALERWAPAPYELIVFHRGNLSKEQQTLLELASPKNAAGQERSVNLTVRTVDLDAKPPAELLELWKAQKNDSVPAMVLRNPRGSAVEEAFWSGPFTEAAMRRVLDSPIRTRMAERLLKGDSAVWVLLESGDKSLDDAAEQVLAARVQHLQKTLKLAEIEPDDIVKHQISAVPGDLKVAFSVRRVGRNDPAEEILVRMLLASEDDLEDAKEPMAFPIFGRGRALFALVGKGISHETIDEACAFVIGPCSCVVKELNPGQDLLMSANWGSLRTEPAPESDEALLASAGVVAPKPGTLVPIAPGLTAAPIVPNVTAANTDSPRPRAKRGIVAVLGGLGLIAGFFGVWAFTSKRS